MHAGLKAVLFVLVGVVLLVAVLTMLQDSSHPAPSAADTGGSPRSEAGTSPMLTTAAGEQSQDGPARSEVEPGVDPAALATPIRVTGRLVQDGRPVAGIDVTFRQSRTGSEAEFLEFAEAPGGRAQATAATDQNGRFTFAATGGKRGYIGVDSDDHVLVAESDLVSVPASREDVDLGDIAVAAAASVTGMAVDPAGRPVAGAEISIADAARSHVMAGFGQRNTKTDEAGRFAFKGLRATDYRLVSASPRHLPAEEKVELDAGEHKADVVLTLRYGGTVSGRVVDDIGRAIAGAKVGAYRKRQVDPELTVSNLSGGESVETDAAGTFTLGGIQDEVVSVRAWHDGHQPASLGDIAMGATDVVLTLARNGKIEGRLVDDTGHGIAGSTVRARSGERAGIYLAGRGVETDDDGNFVLDNVAPGQVTVTATGDMHRETSARATVTPGEVARGIRLTASRGSAVVATVVDQIGRPVAGARVEVVPDDTDDRALGGGMQFRTRTVERTSENGHEDLIVDGGGGSLGQGVTDAEGRVTIGGLPAGSVKVSAKHEDFAPAADQRLTLAASGTVEAQLALREGGAIELLVLDVDRKPVAGVNVAVEGPAGTADASAHRAKTDDQGVARIERLLEGSYSAVVSLAPRPITFGNASILLAGGPEGSPLEESRIPVTIKAGTTAEATLIQPVLTTLTGVLTDADGPVVGGKVELNQSGDAGGIPEIGGQYSAKTDDLGRYEIENVPNGEYVLEYGRNTQKVRAREEISIMGQRLLEHDLRLTGGSIRVVVLDSDGEPLRRAKVTVESGEKKGPPRRRAVFAMISMDGGGGEQSMELGMADPSVQTDEDGVATIEDVPPGTYALRIEHDRHSARKVDGVIVVANSATDVGVVELAAAGLIRGSVVDASGSAPMIANIELLEPGADEPVQTVMAMRGSFQFQGIAPGNYRVRARGIGPDSGEPGPAEPVEVFAGRSTSVAVKLR